MTQIVQARAAIRHHAKSFWAYSDVDLTGIELNKVDVAVDLNGSFIPTQDKSAKKEIGRLLEEAVREVFSDKSMNFLSLKAIGGLRVVGGGNSLDTCYQYAVMDAQHNKLLKVKVYDKMLDLISRDGCHLVGSRVDHILGSSGQFNTFIKRVC